MNVFCAEPLARHGYWRVGGPMERFVVVESGEELARMKVDHVLGNGSNLLVPDDGLPGTTVRLAGEFRAFELDGFRLRAGAGLLNTVLLSRLARTGLAGLAPLAGVPGTVGGAVAMNAGTALGEIADVLESVDVLVDGRTARLSRGELPMKYREGGLPAGAIVTHATFLLREDPGEAGRVAAHLARRRETQPLDLPSCGSVFRNPPGDHAGRLVESVGLKGWRHGGAQISERHANFIVNLGHATAADVMACIRKAEDTVLAETGVTLVREVHVLGEFS